MKVRREDIAAEIEAIKGILSHDRWFNLAEIRLAMSNRGEERTVQRRLGEMIQAGIVEKMGRSRATRYRLAEVSTTMVTAPGENQLPTVAEGLDVIRLSTEGRDILAAVRQPIQQRYPVTYNRGFVDIYEPNKTSYLTTEQKTQLAVIGHTPDAGQPAGTYVKKILQRLLIDLSWNSSRLEGNTYSFLETERLIEAGQEAAGKSAADTQMILNHKDAIEFIADDGDHIGFNRYTILNLHALLSNNLLPDPSASGRLRRIPVGIQGTVYTPTAIPQLIEELFDAIIDKARRIEDPFEQALFSMVHLPYLQPFDDVNKRVSRLVANIPFRNQNLSPLSFTEVPRDLYTSGVLGVYELNRTELLRDIFVWSYGRSAARYAAVQQSLGEPDPFRLKYRTALQSLINGIISASLSQGAAWNKIREEAARLPEADRKKFIDVAERELSDLHEGNFARYRVTPAEFGRWKEKWGK